MKVSQAPLQRIKEPEQDSDPRVTPEMRKAAEGLESVFTSKIMDAMRKTTEPSEFSLHNSASDIYQGMLDQEYSDIAARKNSIGLAKQIIDYWLRDQPKPQYNDKRDIQSSVSTGGTHESQSNE